MRDRAMLAKDRMWVCVPIVVLTIDHKVCGHRVRLQVYIMLTKMLCKYNTYLFQLNVSSSTVTSRGKPV